HEDADYLARRRLVVAIVHLELDGVVEALDRQPQLGARLQYLLLTALEFAHGCVDVAGLTSLEVGHLPKIEDHLPLGLSRAQRVADEENNHEATGDRATHGTLHHEG